MPTQQAPEALELRLARAADAEALARLSAQLGYPNQAAAVAERLAAIHEFGLGEVFAAVLDGGVVGWLHVALHPTLEHPLAAEILGLVIDGGVRSRGIGARLVAAAEDWARAHGCAELVVRSNVLRERAHAFYDARGFLRWKRQQVFRKSL